MKIARFYLFTSTLLFTLLITTKAETKCTKDVMTVDCAKSLGNIISIEHGKSFNMYCFAKQDQPSNENISKDLYFTRNNVELSSNLIEIVNSTTIKLYVEKPPVSESIYICRSRSDDQAVEWNAVVVETKPTNQQLSIVTSIVEDLYPYKVVCYVLTKAWQRPGADKFVPNNIDTSLCTHVVYGVSALDENKLTLIPDETSTNAEIEYYKEVTALKARGIKVSLGFVGWEASGNPKYSRLINDRLARRHFIVNAVDFLDRNNFDGIDLMWFYPKCWQSDCHKGPVTDKPAFAKFVKELHNAFADKGMLLSATVSQWVQHVENGYDLPNLSNHLDWITILTHRYYGEWSGNTAHTAPLYPREEDKNLQANIDYTIKYFIQQGVDKRKMLITIPTIGQIFPLSNNQQHGLYAPAHGGRMSAYSEICKLVTKSWTVVQDPSKRIGPYAYYTNQWISFDDAAMARHKSEYIKSMGLGGASVWTIDFDDFGNKCNCEHYPILKAVNRVLRNYAVYDPNCQLPAN